MKILHFPHANDGCTHYRHVLPLRALEQYCDVETFEIKPSTPDDILEAAIRSADVLFIRASNSGLRPVMELAKQGNPKLAIVADTDDDLFDITPLNNSFQTMGQYEVQDESGNFIWKHGVSGFNLYANWHRLIDYRWHLREADVVTTTTARLRERLLEHNDVVAIIPNGLFPQDFPSLNKPTRATIRIVWSGGSSHFEDLMMVKPELKRVLEDFPQTELHIAGQRFGAFMKGLPESRIFFHPWVHPSGHGFRLATLQADIGIAPVIDNHFNHAKSSLKFYEYAALGLATVASNCPPYKDDIREGTGVLAAPGQWYEKLSELITDPIKRASIAGEGQRWVLKHRSMEVLAKDWLDVFEAARKSKEDNVTT